MAQTVEISSGTNSGTITITGMTEDVVCNDLISNARAKMRIRELILCPADNVAGEKAVARRGSTTGQVISKLRSIDGNYLKDKWEEVEEYNPVLKFSDCVVTSASTVIMIRYTLSAV